MIEALFHRSRLSTIYERYLNLQPDTDGRVRPVVKAAHTKTYRFAYADPPLQQYPPESRGFFRAAPGCLLVSVDYSQLEPRIQAHLAQDETDLKAFNENRDIYTQAAVDLFGEDKVPIEASGKARAGERGFAKSFRLGKGYGGRAETMKNKMFCPCPKCRDKMPDTLDLSPMARKAAERRWELAHPHYLKFWEELARQVGRDHKWSCPLGGVRYFTAPWSSELDREVKNCPMQLTAATLMKRRQVELHRLGVPIVLQIHDEFVLECPVGEVDHWVEITRQTMSRPLPNDCGILSGVVFPTSYKVGELWSDLKD